MVAPIPVKNRLCWDGNLSTEDCTHVDRVYGVERQWARCSTRSSELLRKAFYVAVEPDGCCPPQAVRRLAART
jgi:hypothetical protein